MAEFRRAVLEFWNSLSISGTGEARNLKFGVWIECVTYWLSMKNYHQRERGPGYVTDFEILGPLHISGMIEATDVKFGVYVCMYVCGFISRNPYSLSSHEVRP